LSQPARKIVPDLLEGPTLRAYNDWFPVGFDGLGDQAVIRKQLQAVEEAYYAAKPEFPDFKVGDTIDVHVRIKEAERERVQVFNGTVIRRKGRGPQEMFTVRRIVNEEGVERSWPLLCPSIAKIDVRRRGKVRRAKLYYLRDRKGKATRVKELRISREQMAQKEGAKK